MKKRISALCLCGAMCFSMLGTAYAADGTGGKLFITTSGGKVTMSGNGKDHGFVDGKYDITVVEKDSSGKEQVSNRVTIEVKDGEIINGDLGNAVTDKEIGIVLPGKTTTFYGDEPDTDPVTPTTPDRPGRPVIDDDDDDDDDSSSSSISSGGGAGGASSKYIKNESRGNQTITPVTTPSDEWTSTTNIPQFTDVASTDWFYNAVQFVGQNGMMAGSNGRFSPYDKLTRGMMAQILYNMEGAPGGTAASFPDVNASDWFANAATWSASCGYMSGYANGSFGPLDPITREQLASILYRYASAKGYDVTASSELNFTDGGTTSSWAVPAMKWAVGAGVLSGKTGVGGSRLDPLGNATRAEVAQILMNFSQKIVR